MSGLEFIVGTVLAAVPLALEAYDRSGRVYDVYSVFRQYPRELRTIEDKVSAQRTIFRNNAFNLLVAITNDPSIVQDVMKTPSSQAAVSSLAATSTVPNQRNLDSLKDSFTSCCRTAEFISEKLDSLHLQFQTFRKDVGDQSEKNSSSERLKDIGSRFRLGLHKPKIKSIVEELRDSNRDFGLIAEQITKAVEDLKTKHDSDNYRARRSVGTLNILNKYHRTRYASNALYSNLEVQWKCSSHETHVFDVRILDRGCAEVKGNRRRKGGLNPYVICDLSIAHDGSTETSRNSIRLEVEQACESDNDDDDDNPPRSAPQDTVAQQLTAVLELNTSPVLALDPKITRVSNSKLRKVFKRVRTMSHSSQPNASPFSPELPGLTKSIAKLNLEMDQLRTPSGPDLTGLDDLCERSREATVNCVDRSLLGSWTDPEAKLFCVPARARNASQSLSEIISWVAEEPILRSMSRAVLFRLAGDLADGIMQFYSTPWLGLRDLSQHIRYIKPEEDTQTVAIPLAGPYFMTQLTSHTKNSTIQTTASRDTLEDAALTSHEFTEARNQLLFEFGIMLLEIGYCRPWQELKKTIMKQSGNSQIAPVMSDYRVAEKLTVILINQMGLAYTKIIRKCIGCDFGLGETDLDNEDLQRKFVTDVVSVLQKLEQHMKDAELSTTV